MGLKIEIKGLKNLVKMSKTSEKAARRGIKAAGKAYYDMVHQDIDAGKSFTPRTGNLQQSITFRHAGYSAVIGTHKEYAPFVEFGTRPHKIMAKKGALKIPTDSGYIFRKSVNHPGSKPYPFLYLNFEERKKKVVEVFWKVFYKELIKNG
ncbi:HK97 gp10 family phage protein [Persephonella sp.]